MATIIERFDEIIDLLKQFSTMVTTLTKALDELVKVMHDLNARVTDLERRVR